MSTENSSTTVGGSNTTIFENFDQYDFSSDNNFQAGIKSILANNHSGNATSQQASIQNAKYFYYNKFINSFNIRDYESWKATTEAVQSSLGQSTDSEQGSTAVPVTATEKIPTTTEPTTTTTSASAPTSSTSSNDPTYPKSFQEICELIASGKPVPGIRQIPNNLAEGEPSAPKLAPKLKPWEKAAAAATANNAAAATNVGSVQASTETPMDA